MFKKIWAGSMMALFFLGLLFKWLKETFDLEGKFWDAPLGLFGMMMVATLIDRFLSSRTVGKMVEKKFWDLFD